jgi:hypothetical protein
MMTVHIYPYVSETSYLHLGPWHGFWLVCVDYLGRASVAALSFVSGYILFVNGRDRPLSRIAADRSRSLLLPMLSWNAIKVLGVLALIVLEGRDPGAEMARYGATGPLGTVTLLTGLNGQPANVPLGFLRDLFVSLLIVRMLTSRMPRFGVPILAALVVLTIFDMAAPVVLRPAILLFAYAGAYCAMRGQSLSVLGRPQLAIPLSVGFGLLFLMSMQIGFGDEVLAEEVPNLLKRASLVGVVLMAGAYLAHRFPSLPVARLRPLLFLAFLSHAIVSQILGLAYEKAGLSPHAPYYVLYFIANPFIFLAAAYAIALVLDRLPPWAQIALRGSVRGKTVAAT